MGRLTPNCRCISVIYFNRTPARSASRTGAVRDAASALSLIQLSSDSESAARPLFLAIIASMSRKISMAITTYYVNILTERSTSIEWLLAVFPESSAFFPPGQGAFHDPALRNHRKGRQFAPLGDLYAIPQFCREGLSQGLACVAPIDEHTLHMGEIGLAAVNGLQNPLVISHIGCRDGNRLRESLGVDR